jgi:hypothetical protein
MMASHPGHGTLEFGMSGHSRGGFTFKNEHLMLVSQANYLQKLPSLDVGLKTQSKMGVVVHAYNPSTWEAKARGL